MASRDKNPRTCIVSRTEKPLEDMIRFVTDPENNVIPDLKRNLPGRGVWITATEAYIKCAIEKGLFSRAFKKPVKATPDLTDLIKQLLKSRVSGLLSMAKKAGALTKGQHKVEEQIRKGNASLIIIATNNRGDGKQKIKSLLEKHAPQTPCVEVFTSDELDSIFGGVNTVHISLDESGITEQIRSTAEKLRRFSA
ncbi:MAG: RNA-binding protein [Pseudomonadota bacterium]